MFLVAGTVGGSWPTPRPAEFLYDNMLIHGTVVEASKQVDVTKLLYLGSSCIYPRQARQPITEDQLLTGPLEPTNEAYALAKITGIKLCEAYNAQYGCNFISAMPTNLYGPGDNFDPVGGHLDADAHAPLPRGPDGGRAEGGGVGHRQPHARAAARRRPGRRLPLP